MAYRRLDPLSDDDCYDGESCPTVYERNDLSVIVQGYITAADAQPVVTLPVAMLTRAAARLTAPIPAQVSAADDGAAIWLVDDHTAAVRGVPVPSNELQVPAGEAAVAIPAAVLVRDLERLTSHAA